MKKVLAAILAIAVLASSLLLVNAAADDSKGIVSLGSVAAYPGDTISVPVKIDTKATGGVAALKFSISYDDSVFELVDTTKLENNWTNGDLFKQSALMSPKAKNPYVVYYEDTTADENAAGNKTVGTLKLRVKDTAKVKAEGYELSVVVDSKNTINLDGKKVAFDVTNAKVTLSCKNHKFGAYTYNNDATCAKDGTETATCSVCGFKDTRTKAGTKTDDHKFGAYTYNNDATCQKDGTETATCSVCNKKDTRTKAGSKVDHKFTKYVNDNNATCQKNATETASCDFNCGAKDTRDVANSTVNHKFTNYVSNKDATCTADGTKTAKCDYGCGKEDTVADKGSALGHKFGEFKETKAPTCTEKGTKTASCENAGCTEIKTEDIPALGHEVKEWTVTEEATLEKEGKRTGTCDRCKETIEEPIPKLTKEVKTGDDAKVEVVIDSDEPFTGYTEVKVGEVATSEADKVDGKDVVGGYKIDIIDADTNEPVAADKKVNAKIKLTDAMKAAYKDFDAAIDGTALGATVTEDGYLTFTAEAGKLAKVVVIGTKIETNGGNNGSNSGENDGNSGSSTSPKTGEATGAALAVTLFAAAAAGVVLSKKKRG